MTTKTISTIDPTGETAARKLELAVGTITEAEYDELASHKLAELYRREGFTLEEAVHDGKVKGADPAAIKVFRRVWAETEPAPVPNTVDS